MEGMAGGCSTRAISWLSGENKEVRETGDCISHYFCSMIYSQHIVLTVKFLIISFHSLSPSVSLSLSLSQSILNSLLCRAFSSVPIKSRPHVFLECSRVEVLVVETVQTTISSYFCNDMSPSEIFTFLANNCSSIL